MDGGMEREASQSSKIEVYKDAFAHQPRRRTKAWERAPVDAHAPRLQGQKIWKKVGYGTAPPEDKENFESALAELEKAGVGSRKKQRVMGAKENISDAQWQLIQQEKHKNTLALQSPKKNGRLSLAVNEDALLVPRKRTNANHLITPRKPLRKRSNGSHADHVPSSSKKLVLERPLTIDSELEGAEEDGSQTKILDGASQLPVSNSPEATPSIVIEAAEKPERKRKSLRRSTRRVTQGDIGEPAHDILPKSPSNPISLPSFKVSPAVEGSPTTAIQSMGNTDTGLVQELNAQEGERDSSNHSTNNVYEVSSTSGRPALKESTKYEDSNDIGIIEQVEESSDALANQQILEEASLTKTTESGLDIDRSLCTLQEETPTTPEPTIDIQPARLESLKAIVSDPVATTPSTPKSKRKNPQRGSRRSSRTTRTRSSAAADLFVQGVETSNINESGSVDQATSPLASRGVNLLHPQHEYPTMSQDSTTTTSKSTSDKIGSYPIKAYSVTEEIAPNSENAIDEESNESSGSLSHEIGTVKETIEINVSPQSDALQFCSPLPEVEQTEGSDEIVKPASTKTIKVDTTPVHQSSQTYSLSPEVEQSETSIETAAGAADAEPMDVVASPEAAPAGTEIEVEVEDAVQTGTTDDMLSMSHDHTVLSTASPDMRHIVNLFPAARSSPQDDEPQTFEPDSDDAFDESAEELEVFEPIDISVTIEGVDGLVNEGIMGIKEPTLTDTVMADLTKKSPESDARPLVDHEDTDLLRDFMNKVKASKAAKAATSIPKRKRSLPHSPLRLPLETEGNSSPSPAVADDDEFDVSLPTESPNKRHKRNDPSLEEDELAEPRSTRRSRRTRLPMKTASTGPSLIPVRRLNQDADNTVTLKRSEDKELAALTKINTRKNKGAAVYPAQILAKKAAEKEDPVSRQRALKEVFDEKAQKKKENKKSKNVVWAEELAQFQTDEGKTVVLEKEVEVEQQAVEKKKKTAVKVGMRSKMSLGMAANGTPASKKMRAPRGHS